MNGSQETPARPSGSGLSVASTATAPAATAWQPGNGKASLAHTASQNGSSSNGRHRQASTAAAISNGTDRAQQASAADIVEGWVGNNLNSFVSDPATVTPRIASPEGPFKSHGAASASSTSDTSRQQPQPASGNGRLNGQQTRAGQHKQGFGQGRYGPSGGSWATVDDEMEKARQFLSPWR